MLTDHPASADVTLPQPRVHTAKTGEQMAVRLAPLPPDWEGECVQATPPQTLPAAAAAAEGDALQQALPRFSRILQLFRPGDPDPQLPSDLTRLFVAAYTDTPLPTESGWRSYFLGNGVPPAANQIVDASKPQREFMRACNLLTGFRSLVSLSRLLAELRTRRRFAGNARAQRLADFWESLPPYTGFGAAAALDTGAAAAAAVGLPSATGELQLQGFQTV